MKKENSKFCRLLGNDSMPLDGWTYKDPGNWAEPKDWKETRIYESYQCLEKVKIGKLSSLDLTICQILIKSEIKLLKNHIFNKKKS